MGVAYARSAPDGWWPYLSPRGDWVAYGNQQTFLANLATGVETRVPFRHPAGFGSYPAGWLSPDELLVSEMYASGDPATPETRILYAVAPGAETMTIRPIAYDPQMAAGYAVRASVGRIATFYGKQGEISYNGARLRNGCQGVQLHGPWLVTADAASHYEWLVYLDGTLQRTIEHGAASVLNVVDGWVGYGYPGCRLNAVDGADRPVSVAPWLTGESAEGAPVLVWCDGVLWGWTLSWQNGVCHIWGRPLVGGSDLPPGVIETIESECPLSLSIVPTETDWIFAGHSDRGALRVWSVPKTQARIVLEAPPPPPPTILPNYLDTHIRPFARALGTGTALQDFMVINAAVTQIRRDGDPRACLVASSSAFAVNGCRADLLGLKLEDGRLALIAVMDGATHQPTWVPLMESAWPSDQSKARDPMVPARRAYVGIHTFDPASRSGGAATLSVKGWERVRIDCQLARTQGPSAVPMAEEDARTYHLKPLYLILTDAQVDLVPPGSDVEYLNEPNIGTDPTPKLTPAQYRARLLQVLKPLQDKGCTVYAGSVSNFFPACHQWLKDMLVGVPMTVRVATHRYPDPDQDPDRPKKGYRSLAEEMAGFKAAIGSRQWACTEFGFNTAPYEVGFWFIKWNRQRSDEFVAKALLSWLKRFQQAGAEFAVVYQYRDGPTAQWIDRYGVRRTDGTYKVSADVPQGF